MMNLSFPREHKQQMIERIQHYYEMERDEEIGNLAAEMLLDFMMKEIGPLIYNEAIREARNIVQQKWMNLEEDLYALEQPVPKYRREESS